MGRYTPKPTAKARHNWCGPYALAVLFGCSYDRAYDLALSYLGKNRITGMWNSEMLRCIERRNNEVRKQLSVMKLDVSEVYNYETFVTGERGGVRVRGTKMKNKTLTQWYKTRPDKRGTYLVQVTGHYVIVSGTQIIDNNSKEWQPFHKRRRNKRSFVRSIWQIERSAA